MPAVLADIAPELVAALALAAVLCVYFLVTSLENIAKFIGVPNWPLIGGTLYRAIESVTTWVGQQLAWLWQHANPVTMFIATTSWLLHASSGVLATVITDIYVTIARVTTSSIPAGVAQAENLAHSLFATAVADVSAGVTAAENLARSLYTTAVADVGAALHTAEAFATTLYNDGLTFTEQRVAAAEAAAVGLVQSLQGWVLQELGTIRTWVTGEIGAAVQGVEGDIGSAVNGLEKTLAPEIAGAAAIGAAAAAAFNAWKSECGDPLCSNLNGFGNIIGAIEGALTDVVLLALLAGAVADPQGTATAITDLVVDPVTALSSGIADAIGLAKAA